MIEVIDLERRVVTECLGNGGLGNQVNGDVWVRFAYASLGTLNRPKFVARGT
jgi:hypothetical protein